ncbi:hypothetical protein GDO86_017579 [Hymenochirus boettgeri]|uniref:Dynein regulatory complex subunit 3 n=1 Tax=Hymenochirus boettgeri TaxID=247094 RepID=A0A8T2IQI8_9PIPI|nr:hypothetical protein GDO86_017579 [Hymenochirus boettgeri]
MSGLYDTMEPNVIDDTMLKIAVEEQGPKEEAGRIAKLEGIDFKHVTSLRLDFKNILKIDNLWQFHSLTKLQLDNNIIETISGLETLVHLVWLGDKGLNKLTKLEDLSLYNNRITVIENMETLTNLQVLSLGNNNLTSLENLIYLRRFRQLRTLNLAGNPLSEDEQYKMFIAAHLPDLVYLDFRLLDDNIRDIAMVKYQYSIEDLTHNESQLKLKQEKEEQSQRELDSHKAAYVEYLNGPFLFESMFAEDADGTKLSSLSGCMEISQNIFEYGMKQHEKRESEVAVFYQCMQEAIGDNQEQSAKKIMEFAENNDEILNELSQISDQEILDSKTMQYSEDINQLMDLLMMLELQLVEQTEVIHTYSAAVSVVTIDVSLTSSLTMAQIRDLENHHHEKLLEISVNILEKVLKGEMDEEITDDLRMIFVDKDTVVNAVSASHDIHMLKIDNREDDLVTKINTWANNLIQKVQKEEFQRNRKRVTEISLYIDHLKEELDNLELHDQM